MKKILTLILLSVIYISCEKEKSGDNRIVSIDSKNSSVTIDHEKNSITLTFEKEADVNNSNIIVNLPGGASISPELTAKNIKTEKEYTVIAENGKIRKYTLSLVFLKSKACDIISFKLNEFEGTINENEILINVLKSSDISSVTPELKVSENATVTCNQSLPYDLSKDIEFTVNAEDGNIKKYSLKVNYIKGLESIELIGGENTYEGEINYENYTVNFDISYSFFAKLLKVNKPIDNKPNIADPNTYAKLSPKIKEGFDVKSSVKVYYLSEKHSIILTDKNGYNELFSIKFRNEDCHIEEFTFSNQIRYRIYNGELLRYEYKEAETKGLPNEKVIITETFKKDDITNIKPTIKLCKGATISISEDDSFDFNNDQTFTVTSETGKKTEFTVRNIKRTIIYPNMHFEEGSSQELITLDKSTGGFSYFERYTSYSNVKSIILKNIETQEEVTKDVKDEETDSTSGFKRIYSLYTKGFSPGDYSVTLIFDNDETYKLGYSLRLRYREN